MAKNPYFNLTDHNSEQTLHEDLIIEAIKIYGQDFVYIVRDDKTVDVFYGENPLSKFKNTFEIEMYIQSVDGFEGDKKFMSKFGVEIRDAARLMVAKRRFHKEMPNNFIRPREGDLIYFPLDKSLHEIHIVEDENVFYPLGNLPVYKLSIEKFEYSHENFETNYPIIDDVNQEFKYSFELNLEPGGSGPLLKDEIIFQGSSYSTSTASAYIHSYDPDFNRLRIYRVKGDFKPGPITVVNSTSSYVISSSESLNIKQDKMNDNKTLEDKGKEVYDFSEKDPFSYGGEY
jgi:hypothetical protein